MPDISLIEDIGPFQSAAVSIILLFLLIGYIGLRVENKFFKSIGSNATIILTSLGIFFTFTGIYFALIAFDTTDINAAIPRLLDGLKLAFLSSVVGLGSSILFRSTRSLFEKESESDDISGTQLLDQLSQINEGTVSVKDALIGDGDSSLSTQLGKLRNDFRDFADKVAQEGSSALIEALENVIKDFNAKINEQFGENFKQLNEAVGKLLEWQKEYKDQVEKLTNAFIETQKGIDLVKESVEKIEVSTGKIPDQMIKIEDVFKLTEDRMEEIHKGLGGLSEMRNNAVDAVPFIQSQITELTENINKTITDQIESIKSYMDNLDTTNSQTKEFVSSVINEIKETQKAAQDSYKTSLDEFAKSTNEMFAGNLEKSEKALALQMEKFQGVMDSMNLGADKVLESASKIGDETQKTILSFQEEQNKYSKEMYNKLDDTVKMTQDSINSTMQELDKSMQEELQRSLDVMGNNLASITKRFVDTYEPFAERVQSMMRQTNQNERN